MGAVESQQRQRDHAEVQGLHHFVKGSLPFYCAHAFGCWAGAKTWAQRLARTRLGRDPRSGHGPTQRRHLRTSRL